MSEEFHDWLEQCPVVWTRLKADKYGVVYIFMNGDEGDEEE